MTPRDLFNIIIKIFGLFFLKEIIDITPQLISFLLYLTKFRTTQEEFGAFIFTALILAFYVFLVFKLLFKTNYIIDKLRLDQGFSQEKFSFNISTSIVLTIALLIIGGAMLANEIPNLCRQIFSYFQEKRMTGGMTKPSFSYSIISAVKIIIALLLIGERTRIISFIEKQHSKKGE